MADTKPRLFTALTGAGTAAGDLIPAIDVSGPTESVITVDELGAALQILGAITAEEIPFTPVGTISAATIGAALAELDTEKTTAALSAASFVSRTGGGRHAVSALGDSGAGTVTLDLANANVFTLTLNGTPTIAFAGGASAVECALTLKVTQDATGGRGITWPAGGSWPQGAPNVTGMAASAIMWIVIETLDNFTSWTGFYTGTAQHTFPVQISPIGTALVAATHKVCFPIPPFLNGFNLTGYRISVYTESSAGDITGTVTRSRRAGTAAGARTEVSMLTTEPIIQATEQQSNDGTEAVINATNDDVVTDDFIKLGCTGTPTGAEGLMAWITFTLP